MLSLHSLPLRNPPDSRLGHQQHFSQPHALAQSLLRPRDSLRLQVPRSPFLSLLIPQALAYDRDKNQREQRKRMPIEKICLGTLLMLLLIVSQPLSFDVVRVDPPIDAFLVDFARADRKRRDERADLSAPDRRTVETG